MLTVAGIIGGVLPDIDLKHSQPSRALFSVLGAVAGLTWLFSSLPHYTALELWLGAIAIALLVRFPAWWLFHHATVHRGVFHSLIAMLMFGVLTTAIAWQQLSISELQCWLLGLFLSAGYLLHLVLDELYSVDFTGVRIKRSFGSALKPLSTEELPASCLVIFITVVAWFWAPGWELALNQWQSQYLPWRSALLPQWLTGH